MVPLPPPLHLLLVTVEKSEKRGERRGEQRNNSKADSLKFFFLFPYREDALWRAGGSWLKGAEKGDSSLVVSEQTHASLFCVCHTSQPSSPAWWVMEERLVPLYVRGGRGRYQHATCRVVLMYEFHTCSDLYGTIGAVVIQKAEIYQHFSAPSALVEECLLHNPPSALWQTVHHQTFNVFDSSLTSVVTVTQRKRGGLEGICLSRVCKINRFELQGSQSFVCVGRWAS